MNARKIALKAARLRSEYDYAGRKVAEEAAYLSGARGRVRTALKAQEMVQTVAQAVQKLAHEQITKLVTRCLRTVYGDTYKFKIVFERKRGKTEARLVFKKKNLEVDPLDDAGGVLDVAAFALRLACLVLQRPKRRKLLVLDEPFKMLSKNYTRRMRSLLLSLCQELDLQLIMVTHNPQLCVGKVVEFHEDYLSEMEGDSWTEGISGVPVRKNQVDSAKGQKK